VPFADLAFGIGAGSIEITQRHPPQTVGLAVPAERALDRELRLAVRVDRQLGHGLADRHLGGSAVCRAGRGKDDFVDPDLAHRFEQRQGPTKVIGIIQGRIGNRLADIGISREMHHDRDAMPLERRSQLPAFRDVALDQRPPAYRLAVTTRKIVENHRTVSGPRQDLAGVAADVTGATRDQNRL
jgi:hypothetical protein